MDDRSSLVATARQSIRKGSKSFAAASALFDRETRERVWLLYAWCRRCDDLIDDQDHGGALGGNAGAADRIGQVRGLTALAFVGKETGDPAFDAFGLVARETGLTLEMAGAVLDGFALDAADWQPRTEADLMRYCWHVAGAVGVMMAVVMGVSPQDDDTLDRACDLGLAFQLANIARDLAEDDAAERCYVPLEWLAEADIPPGEQMKPPHRAAMATIAQRMCRIAHAHECSARIGASRLQPRQRWAILAAAGIYGEIAREVERRGPDAWHSRTVVSGTRKVQWIGRAGLRALRPVPRSCLAGADERRFTRRDLIALAGRRGISLP
ncbi:phytoene/squalene synthase family protein [Novosphingobium sp. KCTC 2891]|uniref:phytoene/squalene synthase family protein n=1 Tax=Novosphingobium sp. KCTC 2891 TaxID=2989730 RepID=UPI00222362C3|nr:phytoene/squalene synthase family protein [Novosphingobium sp. KCTC 2891]MCW1384232.1 phytoene/squalene synthase family protein [Novosphingobium sp. KCTC 2891]